jgi:hypothetical protein
VQRSARAFRDHRSDFVSVSSIGHDPWSPRFVEHCWQTTRAFGRMDTAPRIVTYYDLSIGIYTNHTDIAQFHLDPPTPPGFLARPLDVIMF